MVTRGFADKLLAAAGQPTLEALEQQIDADLKPRSAVLAGWTLSARVEIERKIDHDAERGRRARRGRAARRRDGRRRRPLRPPRTRRPALGLARVPLQGHPQRGRRQRLGDVDGARAGPAAGAPARPAAAPGRLHRLLGRGARPARLEVLRRASALSARIDRADGQLRHGRPAQRQERADRLRHRHDPRARHAGRRARQVGGLHHQEDRRRARAERPAVVLPQEHPRPLRLHRHPPRLSPAQRRHRADQLPGMARIADFAELLLLDVVRRPQRPEFVKVERKAVGPAATTPRATPAGSRSRPTSARSPTTTRTSRA